MQDALLLIDKPKGPTSHDVVHRVRALLKTYGAGDFKFVKPASQIAVGHAGTLDPLATGLLVLLVGRATKISDLVLQADKQYLASIRLGVETDTWDAQGQVLSTQPVQKMSQDRVLQQAQQLQKEKSFPLPVFSAVKHKGQRLHKLARRGLRPDKPIFKPMCFYNLKNLHYSEGLLRVQMDCSKGSYVRAYAHVLGQRLGCGAHIENLRRLKSFPFDIEQAVSLEDWEKQWMQLPSFQERVLEQFSYWVPLEQALQGVRKVFVRYYDRFLLLNGQISYTLANHLIVEQKQAQREQRSISVQVACAHSQNLLALVTAHPHKKMSLKSLRS